MDSGFGTNTLYEVVSRERSRRFVGREAELAVLESWLADPDPPTYVFAVTGMGGIGKSALLLRMSELVRHYGVREVWIDGRACNRTPRGLIDYLTATDSRFTPAKDGAVSIEVFLPRPGERTVWFVDDFEELEPLDGWLRERFFGAFPARGQLLVLASRRGLSDGWLNDPGWKQRVHVLHLEPLTRQQSRTYLERAGVTPERIDQLLRHTRGLPLAVSIAADLINRGDVSLLEADWEELQTVNARLLLEAADSDLGAWLDVLTVVPEADAELLAAVSGKPVPADRLAELARLSFVLSTATGFRLHDVARHHLAADFRRRDPSGFERVRRRAVDFLLQRLDTAPRSQRHGIAATLLNVCADALPSAATYADLSISGNLVVQMANERYLPGIQRLLRGAGTQPILFDNPESYPRLMNRIVAEAPEWCRIVFDSEGQVVGFFVAVLLYRDSIALIEDIEPDAVRLHLPEEYDHFARLSADEADTYLAVMVAAEENHPEYRGGELMGVIIRDGLARLGDGTRAILRTNRSDLEELLRMLGFTRYYPPESEEAKADPRRSRFQLDLRHGRFGPWVLSLLEAMARKPAPTRPAREFTVDDVRALLTDAHDADAWAASPVPRSVGIPAEELRAKVKHFLSGREPCPPPLTEYDAELLYKTYWRRIAADAVAAELHISRATYYRHLRRATERLQQALAGIAE